jgi:hypothetical protein
MGQDYPFTGPSPGANPDIYPSSLPLASGKMLPNIFPRALDFSITTGLALTITLTTETH